MNPLSRGDIQGEPPAEHLTTISLIVLLIGWRPKADSFEYSSVESWGPYRPHSWSVCQWLPCCLMAVCSRDFPVRVRPLSVEFGAERASEGLSGPHWSPHRPPLVSTGSQGPAATSGNTVFIVASTAGPSHSGHRGTGQNLMSQPRLCGRTHCAFSTGTLRKTRGCLVHGEAVWPAA